MNKTLLLTLFVFIAFISFGQNTIQGLVYDGETDTPLPGANVFIANTTKGTSTDANGAFTITGLQAVPYELVISYVGYKTQAINIVAGERIIYKVMLGAAPQQLAEVVVRARGISRAERAAYLKSFEENFIGRSENAKDTKLENPEDLFVDKDGSTLTAFSDSAVVLRNNGLGYRVKVLLQTYTYNSRSGALHYEGYMVFEPLVPDSERVKRRWAKNRLKAYYGSQMHFLRALYKKQLNEEGFYTALGSNKPQAGINYQTILDSVASTTGVPVFKFPGQLQINYIKESESVEFQRAMKLSPRRSTQLSLLQFREPAELIPDGRFYPVNAMQLSGYWSWELMAESLPLDYEPAEDLKIAERED